MNEVLSELRGLRTFFGACFDAMDSRIDAINARFDNVGTCITQLEDDMGFIRHCFDPPVDPEFFLLFTRVSYFSCVLWLLLLSLLF